MSRDAHGWVPIIWKKGMLPHWCHLARFCEHAAASKAVAVICQAAPPGSNRGEASAHYFVDASAHLNEEMCRIKKGIICAFVDCLSKGSLLGQHRYRCCCMAITLERKSI